MPKTMERPTEAEATPMENVEAEVAIQEEVMAQTEQVTGLRSITEIIEALKEPIHPKLLKFRQGPGNTQLTYIEWHTAVRYLDKYAPGWSSEITNITHTDRAVTVTCRIYIPCLENPYPGIYREDVGSEPLLKDTTDPNTGKLIPAGWKWSQRNNNWYQMGEGFDPTIVAKQQAFKRAAAQFGLGLKLYYE
jgi:hypothetical protein